ncbi:MAG TPA: polysaccharide biosynthesis protein [Flavobacteriaceae bacterium]|nr:polysaccharide biosynthesis protein [Flavobacteriaceae bacterium]
MITIPEACQLVLEAGAMAKGGEIYVFDMGDSMKIMDLAKRMIQLSGLQYPTDIDIEICGLRPGEKIYEELLADGENTQPTYHEKIMIAKVCENNIIGFDKIIDKLINLPVGLNQEAFNLKLVGIIKMLVPEYKSQNSIYKYLDEIAVIDSNSDTRENLSSIPASLKDLMDQPSRNIS